LVPEVGLEPTLRRT